MKTLHKVLVVDDDAVVGRSFDRVLTDKGYDVNTALDGEEALNKCDKESYDVVFTDIRMPGMNGLEVARRIKEKCPWTPVVVITGYGTEENEAEARVLGVNGFVRKPLTPAVIEGITLKALKEGSTAAAERAEAVATAPPIAETIVVEAAETEAAQSATAGVLGTAGRIALAVAAPFIGLVYALTLPFFGLAVLAWFGARAAVRRTSATKLARFGKNVALFVAAPFIGLAYALALPFVGLGIIAWLGARTLMRNQTAK